MVWTLLGSPIQIGQWLMLAGRRFCLIFLFKWRMHRVSSENLLLLMRNWNHIRIVNYKQGQNKCLNAMSLLFGWWSRIYSSSGGIGFNVRLFSINNTIDVLRFFILKVRYLDPLINNKYFITRILAIIH